ncbi:MAG: hypothetical protein IJO14_11740 [Clostridia bacterium]|nr:hypothetical protein [Clostridia bacterium]
MKRRMQKLTALLLCMLMLIPLGVPASAMTGDIQNVYVTYLSESDDRDYTIENPYEPVDWDTWDQYKAALHLHTNASDGAPSIAECVEEHYRLGFDILAISDHAVLGARWDEVPEMVPLYRAFKYERTLLADPVVLTSERRQEILDGVGRDGRGMLEVTTACEANGATPINDCHINTFWSDYGQAKMGIYGDYETVVKQAEKDGGLSFLDHTGEFVGCEDDPDRADEPYYINKFANIFLDYESCIAMDINSGKNNRTRYDVDLWDNVLQLTLPQGRNVSNITFSDGHLIDEYDRAFTMMCMPENTLENLRTCMESGTWFSVARFARKDLGEEFVGVGTPPSVQNVLVDNEADTVAFEGSDYNYIKWISNGKVIQEGTDCSALCLDDFTDEELGMYVRFQITGDGGILYSQAFPVHCDDIVWESVVVPTFDFSTIVRFFVDLFNLILGKTLMVTTIREVLWGTSW